MRKEMRMKVLFIGGTGLISSAVSPFAIEQGIDLYLLNRGNRPTQVPAGATVITADINDEAAVADQIAGMHFDAVVDWIAFTVNHVERDFRLFQGKTSQYVFISSASAYQTPPASPVILESTPLANPYWQYSRNKIACEEWLIAKYRSDGFPVTIVRPSHTYGDMGIPVAVHGSKGGWSVIERLKAGKKVIIHGDGSSLWTLTHNTDFAKAFVPLLGNLHTIGENYHITSDESLTWNQIYAILGDALGVKPQIVHIPTDVLVAAGGPAVGDGLIGDKSHSVIFDNSKVKAAAPGYAATTRFDQGVRRTLGYFEAHPELQRADPEFDAWTDAVIASYEAWVASLPRLA
jgi:nucleoside-diphosphate-sugar epimerase